MVRLTTILILYMSLSPVWGAPVVKYSQSTLVEDIDMYSKEPDGGKKLVGDIVKVESENTRVSDERPHQLVSLRLSNSRRGLTKPSENHPNSSSSSILEPRNEKQKLKAGWQKFKKKIGKVLEKVATVASAVMRFIPNPITQAISAGMSIGLRAEKAAKAIKDKAKKGEHVGEHAQGNGNGNNGGNGGNHQHPTPPPPAHDHHHHRR